MVSFFSKPKFMYIHCPLKLPSCALSCRQFLNKLTFLSVVRYSIHCQPIIFTIIRDRERRRIRKFHCQTIIITIISYRERCYIRKFHCQAIIITIIRDRFITPCLKTAVIRMYFQLYLLEHSSHKLFIIEFAISIKSNVSSHCISIILIVDVSVMN